MKYNDFDLIIWLLAIFFGIIMSSVAIGIISKSEVKSEHQDLKKFTITAVTLLLIGYVSVIILGILAVMNVTSWIIYIPVILGCLALFIGMIMISVKAKDINNHIPKGYLTWLSFILFLSPLGIYFVSRK